MSMNVKRLNLNKKFYDCDRLTTAFLLNLIPFNKNFKNYKFSLLYSFVNLIIHPKKDLSFYFTHYVNDNAKLYGKKQLLFWISWSLKAENEIQYDQS